MLDMAFQREPGKHEKRDALNFPVCQDGDFFFLFPGIAEEGKDKNVIILFWPLPAVFDARNSFHFSLLYCFWISLGASLACSFSLALYLWGKRNQRSYFSQAFVKAIPNYSFSFPPFFSRSQKKTLFRGKHAIDIFRTLRSLHLPYYLPMQSNHFTGEMKQEEEINKR